LLKRIVSEVMLTLLFIGTLTLAVITQPVKAWTGTVYIRADGSIDPPDAPIITYDNVTYTLTDNITSSADGIVIERDNIVIDGAGYTLQGTGSGTGIHLDGRSNVTIKNMTIKQFNHGLYLSYSSNSSVSHNNITENNYHGIYLYSSSNNSITGNNITNNNDGIYLSYSSNDVISGNNIIKGSSGIFLLHSSYNSIAENNIIYNYNGLFLSVSSDNYIYHNNFINNTHAQVGLSNAGANVWDDGYPSGGNYWSDYTGNDTYSGPYQNETGSDGIGDIPYVIDPNNVDHYPLMNAQVPLLVFISPPSALIVIGQSVEFTSVVFGGHPPYSYQWFLNGSAIPNATLSAWVFTPETKGFYIVHLEVKDSLNNTSKSDDSFVTVKWAGTVYIRADGSIDPPDAPVTTYDNITYKLTDDIVSYGDGIIVQRSNVIVNGAEYTVQGLGGGETKGIYLSGRKNVTVYNLTITGFYYGVWLGSSSNNLINENLLEGNTFGVIIYDSSDYNHICNNRITGGSGAGIYAVYPWWGRPPRNNTMYENFISGNYMGIWLFSSDNLIYANNITHNGYYAWYGYGISISGSGNKIFHNNFIGNAYQVTGTTGNIWDDGYPSGGNYWSDYSGHDFYSGPYQNITGSDGIGDTPYIINGTNQDRYPLMHPWGTGTPVANFIRSPSVPEVDEPVVFDASASIPVGGEIVSYEWNLGDGSYASGMIVTHRYGSAGNYTVTLNVTDSEGLWDIEQKWIEVKAPPPPLTVSISPTSASMLLGQSVTFTSTVSGGYTPYTYQWYLNDNPVSGATSDTWTFTPTESGIFYVYLKVTDDKGNTAQSETARITVASVPVGGYSILLQQQTTTKPIIPYITLLAILTTIFTTIKRKTKRKH